MTFSPSHPNVRDGWCWWSVLLLQYPVPVVGGGRVQGGGQDWPLSEKAELLPPYMRVSSELTRVSSELTRSAANWRGLVANWWGLAVNWMISHWVSSYFPIGWKFYPRGFFSLFISKLKQLWLEKLFGGMTYYPPYMYRPPVLLFLADFLQP
jgi:hypothetical protein